MVKINEMTQKGIGIMKTRKQNKEGQLRRKIDCAAGREPADLIIKNGAILNVFTGELEKGDLAICEGTVVGLGHYSGPHEVDVGGRVVCPGFMDGHIHLESSMMAPPAFEAAALPHGTTCVIADPHEIVNVAGMEGLNYMLAATADLYMDVYFMMSSCVPATALDEAGSAIGAAEIKAAMKNDRVLGLAEVMDFFGTVAGDGAVIHKLRAAAETGGVIDGHGPGLTGKDLNAYITAGVDSDHECVDSLEAVEKYKRGQWIMVREGTAAHNLEALMPLFEAPYHQRTLLVTDDRHANDLVNQGHIDHIVRRAIALGADPLRALTIASFNAAQRFHLWDRGALAPGYRADFLVLDDLETVVVGAVYKDGVKVAQDGVFLPKHLEPRGLRKAYAGLYASMNLDPITPEQLHLIHQGQRQRVVQLIPGELTTKERLVPWQNNPEVAEGVDIEGDIVKMAVFERHHHTGHVGLGFLGGYGLKRGAIATSVAHDSHNLAVAGTNDGDMVLAANCVRENGGGLAVAVDGVIAGALPLPIGGLMTDASAQSVCQGLDALKATPWPRPKPWSPSFYPQYP